MAQATAGQWHGVVPETIRTVNTDTRDFQAGDVFLALRGPNFDAHHFAASVADRALAMIGDRQGIALWRDCKTPQLAVDDTLQALGDIAQLWRSQLQHTTVIAISGSYGKTSLRSVLETGFKALGLNVAATRANLNNLIGVPQTLMAVSQDDDIALVECGISECGEMARLAAIVQPDIAILTGITAAHAEGLGGLSGVVKEKALLLNHVADGWCGLGTDVADLLAANHIALPTSYISHGDPADPAMVDWALTGTRLNMSYRGQQATMNLALPAAHWASNMAFAASIMLRYLQDQGGDHTLSDVVTALSGWQPQAGRMQPCAGRDGAVILDDCYNANPVSMQAAIHTLRQLSARKIAILGDMAELGSDSEAAHAGMDITGLDKVFLIGERMHALAANHAEVRWFATTEAAIAALTTESFGHGDAILVKASRSMALERVVELLCQPQQEAVHAV